MIKDKIVKFLKEHLILYSFLISLFFIIGLFIIVGSIITFFFYLGKVFGYDAIFSTTLLFFAFFGCWSESYRRLKNEKQAANR